MILLLKSINNTKSTNDKSSVIYINFSNISYNKVDRLIAKHFACGPVYLKTHFHSRAN